MWTTFTDFLLSVLKTMGDITNFLTTPLGSYFDGRIQDLNLGLANLGLNNLIPVWIYNVTPLQMLTGSLVLTISIVLLVTIIKKFWPFS